MKKTIIAVVGAAGSGKDTVVKMLCNKYGFTELVSYTTRPMREGETDGVEHLFVTDSEVPTTHEQQLAWTIYGGYHYWTSVEQLNNDIVCYIIDEKGLINMINKFGDRLNIISVNVIRPHSLRSQSGVDSKRMARDAERVELPFDYNFTINNNGTLEHLYALIDNLATDITTSIKK